MAVRSIFKLDLLEDLGTKGREGYVLARLLFPQEGVKIWVDFNIIFPKRIRKSPDISPIVYQRGNLSAKTLFFG